MNTLTRDEVGTLGEELYNALRNEIPSDIDGKFIVMDVLTGAYEIGDDHLETIHRLRDRIPGAEAYSKKIGYVATASIGGRIPREKGIPG